MPKFTSINANPDMASDVETKIEYDSEGVEAKMESDNEDVAAIKEEPVKAKPVKEEPTGEEAINEEASDGEAGTKAKCKTGKGKKATPKSPATPKKRGRKAAADKGDDAEEAENDESPTKKKKASPKSKSNGTKNEKQPKARAMPTSYENASPEDKMLLRMKDEENKPWAEIREEWEKMTGEKVGGSTLSGRYTRIKANFVVFSKDDETRLLQFKKEIEDKFETEKWARVSEAIEHAGGGKYPATALQKKFKELSKKLSDIAIGNSNGNVKTEE